jgi:SAM-dependent methyltransferase
VLFSLSYNTMPHHRAVLHKVWQQLRPGGCLVIMDGKLPPGFGGRLLAPLGVWVMKHTMLSNPFIQPWNELADVAADFDMREFLFRSYYICRGTKPLAQTQAPRTAGSAANDADVAPKYKIAAE